MLISAALKDTGDRPAIGPTGPEGTGGNCRGHKKVPAAKTVMALQPETGVNI
jgi:hypothetical protein